MPSVRHPVVPAPRASQRGHRCERGSGRRSGLAASLLACLLIGPSPARGQAGASCAPAGDPQQVAACAVRDFQSADSRLGIRYREAMEAVAADRRVALRQQQHGWLRARDSGCKTETRSQEGTMDWSRLYHACLERATVQRIGELDRRTHAPAP
jgi:uncharacterized protein YecT (DUF1311 family)